VSQAAVTVDLLEPPPPGGGSSAIEARSPWRLAWRRLRSDRVAIACAVVILLIVLVALCAPLIAAAVGHKPDETDQAGGLTPEGLPLAPSWSHPFGTDYLGRDVFIRVVYAARISLLAVFGRKLCDQILAMINQESQLPRWSIKVSCRKVRLS